jgi:CRP/FNR family transcriptional regulator, cyclic AMP receptor protein
MLKNIKQQMHGSNDLLKSMPWRIRRSFRKVAIPVELRPREILFHAGDAGDGCYFVRSGAVKAAVVARDGQERLLAILGPGSLIGELALIDDEPRSATVSALRRCRLMHLTNAAFFRLADANPLVYRQALRLLARRLRGTNDSVVAQGTVTVAGRVARAFASLAEGLGEEQEAGRIVLPHRITQTDIAGMAGVARENASRAINDLLRQGVLGRVGGYYTIERPAELLDLSEI